jgi:hypothetical protein
MRTPPFAPALASQTERHYRRALDHDINSTAISSGTSAQRRRADPGRVIAGDAFEIIADLVIIDGEIARLTGAIDFAVLHHARDPNRP